MLFKFTEVVVASFDRIFARVASTLVSFWPMAAKSSGSQTGSLHFVAVENPTVFAIPSVHVREA